MAAALAAGSEEEEEEVVEEVVVTHGETRCHGFGLYHLAKYQVLESCI